MTACDLHVRVSPIETAAACRAGPVSLCRATRRCILGYLLGAALLVPTGVHAKLNVVATTADLAALAQEIGGKQVTVTTLAKPTEDPHFVDPKPSFITRLNRADVLIERGAELEASWLEPLLDGARNRRLAPGSPARIVAAEGVQMLEVPSTLDRSRGDVHGMGNPHFMVDPVKAKEIAERITAAFCQLDRSSCQAYQANLARFSTLLDEKLRLWQAALKPFEGTRLVAYHNMWPYFGARFGLKIDLFLEPKPGIPPGPSHLAGLISAMKRDKIKVIIVEPFQHRRTAESVAAQTGATILTLTQYPGGVRGTEQGYIQMLDHIVDSLAKALSAPVL